MHRLIISAPFGNRLRWHRVTSTIGTYTLHRRAGFLLRWWRVFSTVRYYHRAQAWINKLGLPSPGIPSLYCREYDNPGSYCLDKILSLWAESKVEWCELMNSALGLKPLAVELNLSCPNVKNSRDLLQIVEPACKMAVKESGVEVVGKLSPIGPVETAASLFDMGVKVFHCCNTIPTPRGGVSGKPLKPLSLWAIGELRKRWGREVKIIGGGGITSLEDVRDYLEAGADHVAVGSMLFNPFAWKRIPLFRDFLEGHFRVDWKPI